MYYAIDKISREILLKREIQEFQNVETYSNFYSIKKLGIASKL